MSDKARDVLELLKSLKTSNIYIMQLGKDAAALIESQQRELAAKDAEIERLEKQLANVKELFGMDTSWPITDSMDKTIEAANILLKDKNYDGTGHEMLSRGTKELEHFRKKIELYLINSTTARGE